MRINNQTDKRTLSGFVIEQLNPGGADDYRPRVDSMSSKGIFLVLVGLFLILTIAVTGCMEKTYDYSSNGATVHATQGDTILVSLGQTPSTGFVWNATVTGDLVITKKEFESRGLSMMPGSDAGTATWYLTAGKAVTQKFTAIKIRPGENITRVVDQFEITILVDNDT